MNEQPLTTESSPHNFETELTEPHFDDIAIAVAQPVQPLPTVKATRWQRFAGLQRHISTTAMLLILAGAISFATVTFGLSRLHQQLTVDEPQTAITPAEESTQTEAAAPSIRVEEKKSAPRLAVRKIRVREIRLRAKDSDSRPVARKIGEITYR